VTYAIESGKPGPRFYKQSADEARNACGRGWNLVARRGAGSTAPDWVGAGTGQVLSTTFVKMLLAARIRQSGKAMVFRPQLLGAVARRVIGYLPENHRFPTYATGANMPDFYGSLSA